MSNQYLPAPPAPSNLSETEMTILRSALSEPALQALIAATQRVGPVGRLTLINSALTVNSEPILNNCWYKITIPASVWTTAGLSQELVVGTIAAKTKVTGCYLDVTEKYAGLAGTITSQVGHDTDPDFFLAATDTKTAVVTLGLTDAQCGVGLTIAASIQGGALPSWTAGKVLSVTLTSGTGNIGAAGVTNLTTGIAVLYIRLQALP